MRANFLIILFSLLTLCVLPVDAHAVDVVKAALHYAERSRDRAENLAAQAKARVDTIKSDLRFARSIENDAQRTGDHEALTIARQAVAENEAGLREAEQLQARARTMLAEREHIIQRLRTIMRSRISDSMVVAESADMRRYNASGKVVEDASGPLSPGDTIRTASGSARLFLNQAGSQAVLEPQSEFTVDVKDNQGNFVGKLEEGAIRLLIHVTGKFERLEVRTPTAVAAVRGTDFAVENHDGQTRLRVFKGVVSVTAIADGSKHEVKAGEQWRVGASGVESFDMRSFPSPWERDNDTP